MIEHRPLGQMDGADLGWLRAKYHFQVRPQGNARHKPLGDLYVWNDDDIAPGAAGFGMHGHRDVEIVTYVREGHVSHRDSLGNEGVILAGDVQVMSAGSGIRHDGLPSPVERTKVYQIWLHPRTTGGEPRWGTKPFPKSERAGRFSVLASGFAEDVDALAIRTDARLLGSTLTHGQQLSHRLADGVGAYLVTTSGRVSVNDVTLDPQDGAAITDIADLRIVTHDDTEVLLVETRVTPTLSCRGVWR